MIGFPQNITIQMIRQLISDNEVLKLYTDIKKIPCKINSPFRATDRNASFCWYEKCGRPYYKDFGDDSYGDVYSFLSRLWGTSLHETLKRVYKEQALDVSKLQTTNNTSARNEDVRPRIRVCVREWEDYDLEYWGTFGIPVELLKKNLVYPISHFWVNYGTRSSMIRADMYAYAYVENKEGLVSYKIYQPFGKTRKWTSSMDKTTLSLWNQLPEKGKLVCVCSSVKDALCLEASTGIPVISLAGEGMGISETARLQLSKRFERVCVLLDSDDAGIRYSNKLFLQTGFDEIHLPKSEHYKDIAECYQYLGKEEFVKLMNNLFNGEQ